MPDTDAVYDDLILFYGEVGNICRQLNISGDDLTRIQDVTYRTADQIFVMCATLESKHGYPLIDQMQSIDIQATAILIRIRSMFKYGYDNKSFPENDLELLKKPKNLRTLIPAIVYVAAKITIDDAYTIQELINALNQEAKEIDANDDAKQRTILTGFEDIVVGLTTKKN